MEKFIAALAIVLCVVSVFISPFMVFAEEKGEVFDGNYFLKTCDKKSLPEFQKMDEREQLDFAENRGFCNGMVSGFVRLAQFYDDTLSGSDAKDKVLLCVPKETMITQWMMVLDNYLKKNPQTLHFNIMILMTLAFQEAFPCEKQQ